MKNFLVTCLHPKNYVHVRRHRKSLWIKHSDTISVLAKGPSDLLYSGSWDKTFKVWRLSDFKCLESIAAHDDAINALLVSSKNYVYTASADAKIKVWERNADYKHSLVAAVVGHKSAVNCLALSKNDSLLYSGSGDRSIMVWEREESAEHMVMLGTLKGHCSAVLCLSAVANFLCSGSADKTIRFWRREPDNAHSCLAVLHGHVGPVKSVCARAENDLSGAIVYSGSLDGQIKVWMLSLTKANGSTSDIETQALNFN
ncbi:hypothetical protein O6H91_11G081800 [Diphasiastrum complanatum]|nr:hypothetical protein O6H91_Y137800 [Diphasiastrum complanatum]KAJ7539225.1 hypothetical protein O6H91_11G081800 [Diphasiastrum complanatum]